MRSTQTDFAHFSSQILALQLYSDLYYELHDGPCLTAIRGIAFSKFAKRVQFVLKLVFFPSTSFFPFAHSFSSPSSLSRILEIAPQDDNWVTASWKDFSSVLAACLPRLPKLRELTIDPRLLNDLLLHNILLSSVLTLDFNFSVTKERLPLRLVPRSLMPRPRSAPTLLLGSLRFWITSKSDGKRVEKVLLFLYRLGIRFRSVELFVVSALGEGSKLLLQRNLEIPRLHITTTPSLVVSLIL